MAASDEEYEYDYSEDEDYMIDDEDDAMDWTGGSTDNPNAAPTISGT